MFLQHNGHQLCEIDEALQILGKEMDDLSKYYAKHYAKEFNKSESKLKQIFFLSGLVVNFLYLGSDKQLAANQKTLEQNKSVQIKFLRQGFEQIIDALIKKKESMIEETTDKFNQEIAQLSKLSKRQDRKAKQVHEVKEEIQQLKDIQTNGDSVLLAKKVKNMKEYIEQFIVYINEQKNLAKQSNKLEEISDSPLDRKQGIGKEFMPIPIDTTSAISYITNFALQDQALTGKKGKYNYKEKGRSSMHSHTPSEKVKLNKMHSNSPAIKNVDASPNK